jgi:hypothetical protein
MWVEYRMRHPLVGELDVLQHSLAVPRGPGIRLVVTTAAPGSPSQAALNLLAYTLDSLGHTREVRAFDRWSTTPRQPTQARAVRLANSLAALTAGIRALPDGSLAVVSSGLLTGEPAKIQRVRPEADWSAATVSVTDTVGDPVTSGITAGPARSTYALSGDLASLLAGKPGSGFTLTRVSVN